MFLLGLFPLKARRAKCFDFILIRLRQLSLLQNANGPVLANCDRFLCVTWFITNCEGYWFMGWYRFLKIAILQPFSALSTELSVSVSYDWRGAWTGPTLLTSCLQHRHHYLRSCRAAVLSLFINVGRILINVGSLILTHSCCLHPWGRVDSVTKQTITRHFVSHNSCRTRAWKEKRVLEACHRVISRLLAIATLTIRGLEPKSVSQLCLGSLPETRRSAIGRSYWVIVSCYCRFSLFPQ